MMMLAIRYIVASSTQPLERV
jgi:hypothetical protein